MHATANASDVRASGDYCRNCGVPLLGEHCHACGQPVKGLVRQFSSIVGDFFDTVFELDNRIMRTLPALLFRPGHLSKEYFAGRRVRYVSPVRLFVFLCIATFFVARLATPAFDIGSGDGQVRIVDSPRDAHAALDTEAAVIAQREAERVRDDEPVINLTGHPWHATDNPLVIDWLPEAGNRWINTQIGHLPKNWKRIREDPELLSNAFYSAVPTAIFVLVPVFALLLKGLYLFERRLYMEHLIVSLHGHAFLCAALLLLIGLSTLEDLAEGLAWLSRPLAWAQTALWLWIPAYLWLQLKRAYGQGVLMTGAKFLLLGLAEVGLLLLVGAAALLAALLWL